MECEHAIIRIVDGVRRCMVCWKNMDETEAEEPKKVTKRPTTKKTAKA